MQVCVHLLEEWGILEPGSKEKEGRGLRGKDNILGVIRSWLRSSTHEPAWLLLGHPGVHGQGVAIPGLCS